MSIPHLFINVGHIVAVAPSIAYLGWKGYKAQPVIIGKNFGMVLILVALIILTYHAYRIKTKSWAEYQATKAVVSSPTPAPKPPSI